MTEFAPDALKWLGSRVSPDLGGQLSGIVGDRAHTYGYHRGRNYVSRGDYSRQLPEDRLGSGEAASAIDMSFSAQKMRLYTGRLAAAADRNDPRIAHIREFYGTVDGRSVYGRTHQGSGDSTWERATSDSSHLWHIHISILRQYANDRARAQGLLDVLMGKPLVTQPDSIPEEDDMAIVITRDLPADGTPVVLALPPVGFGAYTGKQMWISAVAAEGPVRIRTALNAGSGFVVRTKDVSHESNDRTSLWGEPAFTRDPGGFTATFRRESGSGKASILVEIV